MISWLPMGFEEALRITVDTISPLGKEMVPLARSTGRIIAENLISGINSPSINASLKDGYAVVSEDLDTAGPDTPVQLALAGTASVAGGGAPPRLVPGSAMRILTGAQIPEGATAVLAEEFASLCGSTLSAANTAEPGRNIMPKGTDVAEGQCVAEKGCAITPGRAGIIAASGFSEVPVYKKPRVAIISTGDEVVAPGKPLPPGKLYASNMVTLGAFCRKWGMEPHLVTVKDDPDRICKALEAALASSDAVITSGGAWTGDRDLVAKIFSDLGWKKAFHRIRIGPGKAVGFGMIAAIPAFILPGGPPSNLMGFLQIALPGLHVLSGRQQVGLPVMKARISSEIRGRARDWTQFIFGAATPDEQGLRFDSLGQRARLQSMADATAVATIPEGKTRLAKGEISSIQVLSF
ncbi:MAG: molybdopterin molybdotransferase MoeA [Desulfobacter sp.]|nr:MAG: molybdopterin molybdotransferase MoeA [Desulfobacter sp.]